MVDNCREILVGYDGSDESRDALALAERLSALTGGTIVLAYVEGLGPYELPSGHLAEDVHTRAEDELARVAAGLVQRGIAAETRPVAFGSPAQGLIELAEHDEPEMIAVGASHHGRVAASVAGTVGVKLLHGAPCPVAVATKGFAQRIWSPRTIGVAYDGSPESDLALERARGLARPAQAKVQVIVVAETPGTPFVAVPVDSAEAHAEASQEAHRWLERARERLGERLGEDRGLEVWGVVLEGEPAPLITHATGQLDLLVIGSRGQGPLRRVLLGSVASHVLTHTACPVIVTPRGVYQAEAAAGLGPRVAS